MPSKKEMESIKRAQVSKKKRQREKEQEEARKKDKTEQIKL